MRRDSYFDVVKSIAICFVIFGHALGLASSLGVSTVKVTNFIVGMNMPIFFIVSGYFVWPTIEALNWKKLGKHLQSYFQPALFVGLVFMLAGLFFGSVPSSARAMAHGLVVDAFVLPWFITTLAECYVCTFLAYAIGRTVPGMLLVIAVLIAAIVFRPISVGKIHFSCLVNMLPCFLFGAVVLRRAGKRLWESRPIGLACFICFVLFVAFEGNVSTNGMSFYTADVSAEALKNIRNGVTFFLRPLVGIIGSIGVMFVIRMALDRFPRLSVMAPLGTMTLGIYIFHLRPIEWLRTSGCLAHVRSLLVVFLVAIGLLMLSFAITWALTRKVGRFSKLIWGK